MNAKSNFLKKVMCALFAIVGAVAFNSASGAVLATAAGLPAGIGAVAGNAVALSLDSLPLPVRCAPASLLKSGLAR